MSQTSPFLAQLDVFKRNLGPKDVFDNAARSSSTITAVPDTAKLSLMNLTGRMIRLATPTDGVDGPAASVCQDAGCQNLHRKEPPTMSVSMIGLDTAKSVFQVHGVNEAGKAELKRKLRKGELIAFFEKLET